MSLPQMSFYGGVMISAVLLLRALLGRKLPKHTFVVLWGIVLLRLLAPVQITASFSIYSLTEDLASSVWEKALTGKTDGKQAYFYDGSPGASIWETLFGENGNWGGETQTNADFDYGGELQTNRNIEGQNTKDQNTEGSNGIGADCGVPVFTAVRYAGTLVCSLGVLALYINCLRMFRTSLPVENRFVWLWMRRHRLRRFVKVRQSDRIATPLTYGVLHPVILLPAKLAEGENEKLTYILQHELIHIRRFDAALKLVMAAALCLHWFNPLVWVMYVVMNKDVELSCDERVLGELGAEAKRRYALALIEMEEKSCAFLSLHSGFGRNAIEERIRGIMKYKKTTWIAVVAATALVFAVVLLFVTSAGEGESKNSVQNTETDGGERIPQDPLPGGTVKMPEEQTVNAGGTEEGNTGEAEEGNTGGAEEGNTEKNVEEKEGSPGNMAGVQVPAWENVSFASEEYSLTYTLEGMEETEAAWLVYGQGYCILIPTEGWTMYAPDAWMAEESEAVQLWVTHYTGEDAESKSWEQIKETLTAEGYETFENTDLQLQRKSDGKTTRVEIRKNGSDIWGVFYTFPDEAIEGWGIRLAAMAGHFGILPGQDGTLSEADPKALEVVNAFVTAFLKKDAETMQAYMEEGLEVYFADFAVNDPVIKEVKKRQHPQEEASERIGVSVELKPGSEADGLAYMYLQLEKQQEVWRVISYSLEM